MRDVSGVKRRMFDDAFKREVVAEVCTGASIAEVSKRHGLAAKSVRSWHADTRYHDGDVRYVAQVGIRAQKDATASFIPVEVVSDDVACRVPSDRMISLRLDGGAEISFLCEMKRDALLYLLRGLVS